MIQSLKRADYLERIKSGLISSINLAEQKLSIYLSSNALEYVAADLALSQQAAAFKATRKMSYADCFAAALAKTKNCELVTGDAEFKEIEKEIKIRWLDGGGG